MTMDMAQTKQNEGPFVLVIDGTTDCQSLLAEKVTLDKEKDDFWIRQLGASEATRFDLLKIEAKVNCVSYERCLLSRLLDIGYELQELEVEFWSDERGAWGLCTWYKEHPSYADPIKGFEKAHPKWTPFIRSKFKTEKAGDQEFTLLSTQMAGMAMLGVWTGILLHKSLLFRKAVFTSPKTEAKAA